MNLFTVITVTYNAQHTLVRTMKSVQEQTYPHIEHIVVDGNSSDGTADLIKKHETEHTNWISEKDNGIYDAMNKATAMATGNYICYLNAGDTFYDKNTVEKLISTAQQYHFPDILYGETVVVNNEGTFLHNRRLKAPVSLNWKSFKQGMLVCHQAFIVKRSIFEPYDLTYRYSADVDWCIRLMKKSKSIVNSHQVMIKYLNEGITTANRKASLKERYQIMTKHYGAISTLLHHAWFVVRAILKPEKRIRNRTMIKRRKLKVEELNRIDIQEFKEAKKIALTVVLDNIRSLNNIGSVFRTSDAFRVDEVILCGITATPPHVDIHKTALGAEDSVAWRYFDETLTAVNELKADGYTVFSIEQAENSTSLSDLSLDVDKKYAIVLGHEVHGVQQSVIDASHGCIEIPQYGTKHSLNISVATGIVIWSFYSQLGGNVIE